MPHFKANLIVTFALFTLIAVSPVYGGDTSVTGTVLFRGAGEGGVYVEAFDRPPAPSATPVASSNSGRDGRYVIQLPEGFYYLTAKKRPGGLNSVGMLYGTSGERPVKVSGEEMGLPDIVLRDSGTAGGTVDGGVEVSGSLTYLGKPRAGAYVYAYPGSRRRGPGYLSRVRSGEDGRFTLRLPPGLYTLTVRSTRGGEGMGTVAVSDLVGELPDGPRRIEGERVEVGTIELREVDQATWRQSRWAASQTGLTIRGRILSEDGQPEAGVYAFVYSDQRMVGKPLAISPPTGRDGVYAVTVPKPGTYYVGARSRFGGPVEPGERMGAYDTEGIRPVDLQDGQLRNRYDIVVKEVW